MSKHASLLQKVDIFYKLATSPEMVKAVNNTKAAIQAEIFSGIKTLNWLVTHNPAAAKSTAIAGLDEIFGKLSEALYKLNVDNTESIIQNMQDILQKAMMFTSSINAGTGYDSLTESGGARSPAAACKRITTHLANLSNYLKQNEPPSVPKRNIS